MSARAPEMEELAARAVEAALAAGADHAEATAVASEAVRVRVRGEDVERLTSSRGRTLGVRVRIGAHGSSASSTDVGERAIEDLARRVVALARETAPDPEAALPETGDWPEPAGLDLEDETPGTLDVERAIALATAAEQAARAADPRVRNSEGSEYRGAHGSRALVSSRGFRGSYRSSRFSISATPVAEENGSRQVDGWYTAARHFGRLDDAGDVGREAARRVTRKLGARKIPTTKAPVVFDPDCAATLVGHIAGAASGDAIVKRASFFLDRLGSKVAAAAVSVVDDPTLPGALGSRPFDSEGIGARRTPVIEDGVFRSYLLDTRSARRLGLESTGNASSGPGGEPSVAPSNLRLVPGDTAPEDIVRGVARGLYVTDLIGFGVNGITGDYSRGAAGLWIENGELAYPVEEITIAGNLLEMFQAIEVIGSDLNPARAVASPTLLIGSMTIAGA